MPNLAFCIREGIIWWVTRDEQGCEAKPSLVVLPTFHSFSSFLCGIML